MDNNGIFIIFILRIAENLIEFILCISRISDPIRTERIFVHNESKKAFHMKHRERKEVITMNEIKCPHCGKVFQVDEAGYAAILSQVRSEQFNQEIHERAEALHREMEAQQKNALLEAEAQHRLAVAEKEQEIIRLTEQVKASEAEKKHAVDAAVQEKQMEIMRLQEQAKSAETDKQLAIATALQDKDLEIIKLQGQIAREQQAAQIREKSLQESHQTEVKRLEEEVERYRDFKIRQSTKMIGEDLEQHCLNSFNQVRMMAFPNAYFDKDNEIVDGTKGDFVFRESTEDGVPILSIMFEMKNEADDTEKKHKNESFLDKLDKDRKKKNCEYAVLVTMLEMDNELYNAGIVDMSYRYPKMYVIRPQFFIPLISLLRNAALSSVQARRELAAAQQQNLDVRQFEQAMKDFKDKFGRNFQLASQSYENAIKEIDETIKHLEKIKEYLTKSGTQLRFANDKAQELSIKKLTKGNNTMREKFEEAGIEIG